MKWFPQSALKQVLHHCCRRNVERRLLHVDNEIVVPLRDYCLF